MNTADHLEAAAEILETRGWTRGSYRDEHGFCAVGALAEVIRRQEQISLTTLDVSLTTLDGGRWAAIHAAAKAMGFCGPHDGPLTAWNDEQDSAEPVIELMKQTAKDLRNKAVPI